MSKLKKADFNKEYRFRESRNGLISCVTCDSMTSEINDNEGPAFCEDEERFRKIKIAKYWKGWISSSNHNIASECVCDIYTPKPLPEGVKKPFLPEKHAILLGTQFRDLYHADPNCPYIIEELRMQKEGRNKRAEVNITDISEMVPGQSIRAICEMPCCESKLPFQISIIDEYRRRAGIKPDGSEPKRWVRNGIVNHEKKVVMTLEELESVFDLEKFNSSKFGGIHNKIIAVADHLGKHCNRLGSRPLSEAINPIQFSYYHHILEDSLTGPDTGADLWAYDERLFDIKRGLEKPLSELEKIPEGFIPCMDTERIFSSALYHCQGLSGGRFWIYGIIRNLDDIIKNMDNKNLFSKGVNHFIEIGAVSYNDRHYMWGEFGKGFNGLASFHEQ